MVPELVAMHMGALHPYETVLALVLAFGPFLVLGGVIALRRRDDQPADEVDERESELLYDRSA
jgi:hypothetical protein